MQSNSIQVPAIQRRRGAEIAGLDLSEPLTPQARDLVRRTLADRGVVFFRGQSLDARTAYRPRAPVRQHQR